MRPIANSMSLLSNPLYRVREFLMKATDSPVWRGNLARRRSAHIVGLFYVLLR